MMNSSLVFTIIGPDRPGLVEQIARVVNEHDANWLGSRMAQLGGKFAGIIQVAGDAQQLEELRQSLAELSDLRVVVEQDGVDESAGGGEIVVNMLGLDRPGIVMEVSEALAAANLNVIEMQTDVSQAAMTGRAMFSGTAQVNFGTDQDLSTLADRLDEVSRNLGVDIDLEEQSS